MNKTFMRGLLALLVCASLWFAPAAWARDCPLGLPSKYMPNLILDTSPMDLEFDVLQKTDGIALRNCSSEPVYLITPGSLPNDLLSFPPDVAQKPPSGTTIRYKIVDDNFYQWSPDKIWVLSQKGVFNIPLANAKFYMIDDFPSSSCGHDGGILDGQPVPPPRKVFLKVIYEEQLIDVPLLINYEADPNYESKLFKYKNPGQAMAQFILMVFVCGAVLILAIFIFFVNKFSKKPSSTS